MGSLVAALGSYLDAKAHQGRWLLRIDDVDKPRAVAGAADTILQQLDAHGLHWDGEVLYQSQRDARYRAVIQQLTEQGLTYPCVCRRKRLQTLSDGYDRYCLKHPPSSSEAHAIRFFNQQAVIEWQDRRLGPQLSTSAKDAEDFVLRRRDGLYAYQLAVVVDDIDSGVTDIVRGEDLCIPTFWQLTLWQQLQPQPPRYLHLPLVMGTDQRKLSKQNHAPAIDSRHAVANLLQAADYLALERPPEECIDGIEELLQWLKKCWIRKYLNGTI